MQYLLMIYEDEAAFEDGEDGAAWRDVVAAHEAFAGELVAAGAMRGGAGLKPVATATTVRTRDGAKTLHDGPWAETKEQLGGFYQIEAADLDAALAWARKAPLAQDGSIEVRPILDM